MNIPEEIELIKDLNNEFDKEKKKEKTYRKKTISLDMLQKKYNYEFADLDYSPDISDLLNLETKRSDMP